MTKREGAVITAYTGVLVCDFKEYHTYVEELLNRPVMHHEIPELEDEIKEKSRDEFLDILRNQTN